MFTWPNYTESTTTHLQSLGFKYLCFGYEVAPTTGTPHLQGYIVFNNPITLSSARSKLLGAHVEAARDDSLTNKRYCSKTRDSDIIANEKFEEYGVRPLTQQEKGIFNIFC